MKSNGFENGPHVRTIRYKPENRLIAVVEVGHSSSVYVRIESTEAIQVLRHRCEFLKNGSKLGEGVEVSLPLACDESSGIVLLEGVPGEKLSEILRSKAAIEGLKKGVRGMARLHSVDPGGLEPYDTGGAIRRAQRFVELITRHHLDSSINGERISRWLENQLVSANFDGDTLIHGDFHPGQILIDHATVHIIDIDRLAVGAAEIDVGNLLAQLWMLSHRGRLVDCHDYRELIIEGYEKLAGRKLSQEALRLWEVAGLLELAAKQYRRLKPGWPRKINRIFEEVVSLIDSAGGRS
jgi:aminoglycoside phosphotransferase (APT) family kinase protein